MPLLTFTMRSQDLDGGHVADNGTQHAKKTIMSWRNYKRRKYEYIQGRIQGFA